MFGCQVYPYLRDYSAHKLAPRSISCIFIGYNAQYKVYKCLDPSTSRIYITRHARFNELSFPFSGPLINNRLINWSCTIFLMIGRLSSTQLPRVNPLHLSPDHPPPHVICVILTQYHLNHYLRLLLLFLLTRYNLNHHLLNSYHLTQRLLHLLNRRL